MSSFAEFILEKVIRFVQDHSAKSFSDPSNRGQSAQSATPKVQYFIPIFGTPNDIQGFYSTGGAYTTIHHLFGSFLVSPQFQPVSKELNNVTILTAFGRERDDPEILRRLSQQKFGPSLSAVMIEPPLTAQEFTLETSQYPGICIPRQFTDEGLPIGGNNDQSSWLVGRSNQENNPNPIREPIKTIPFLKIGFPPFISDDRFDSTRYGSMYLLHSLPITRSILMQKLFPLYGIHGEEPLPLLPLDFDQKVRDDICLFTGQPQKCHQNGHNLSHISAPGSFGPDEEDEKLPSHRLATIHEIPDAITPKLPESYHYPPDFASRAQYFLFPDPTLFSVIPLNGYDFSITYCQPHTYSINSHHLATILLLDFASSTSSIILSDFIHQTSTLLVSGSIYPLSDVDIYILALNADQLDQEQLRDVDCYDALISIGFQLSNIHIYPVSTNPDYNPPASIIENPSAKQIAPSSLEERIINISDYASFTSPIWDKIWEKHFTFHWHESFFEAEPVHTNLSHISQLSNHRIDADNDGNHGSGDITPNYDQEQFQIECARREQYRLINNRAQTVSMLGSMLPSILTGIQQLPELDVRLPTPITHYLVPHTLQPAFFYQHRSVSFATRHLGPDLLDMDSQTLVAEFSTPWNPRDRFTIIALARFLKYYQWFHQFRPQSPYTNPNLSWPIFPNSTPVSIMTTTATIHPGTAIKPTHSNDGLCLVFDPSMREGGMTIISSSPSSPVSEDENQPDSHFLQGLRNWYKANPPFQHSIVHLTQPMPSRLSKEATRVLSTMASLSAPPLPIEFYHPLMNPLPTAIHLTSAQSTPISTPIESPTSSGRYRTIHQSLTSLPAGQKSFPRGCPQGKLPTQLELNSFILWDDAVLISDPNVFVSSHYLTLPHTRLFHEIQDELPAHSSRRFFALSMRRRAFHSNLWIGSTHVESEKASVDCAQELQHQCLKATIGNIFGSVPLNLEVMHHTNHKHLKFRWWVHPDVQDEINLNQQRGEQLQVQRKMLKRTYKLPYRQTDDDRKDDDDLLPIQPYSDDDYDDGDHGADDDHKKDSPPPYHTPRFLQSNDKKTTFTLGKSQSRSSWYTHWPVSTPQTLLTGQDRVVKINMTYNSSGLGVSQSLPGRPVPFLLRKQYHTCKSNFVFDTPFEHPLAKAAPVAPLLYTHGIIILPFVYTAAKTAILSQLHKDYPQSTAEPLSNLDSDRLYPNNPYPKTTGKSQNCFVPPPIPTFDPVLRNYYESNTSSRIRAPHLHKNAWDFNNLGFSLSHWREAESNGLKLNHLQYSSEFNCPITFVVVIANPIVKDPVPYFDLSTLCYDCFQQNEHEPKIEELELLFSRAIEELKRKGELQTCPKMIGPSIPPIASQNANDHDLEPITQSQFRYFKQHIPFLYKEQIAHILPVSFGNHGDVGKYYSLWNVVCTNVDGFQEVFDQAEREALKVRLELYQELAAGQNK